MSKINDGALLETILTAPLVVARTGSNLQYYASTRRSKLTSVAETKRSIMLSVDSGSLPEIVVIFKPVCLGSPVHTGTRFQHEPLRLLAVIAAPRHALEVVLAKHESLAHMVEVAGYT